MRSITKCFVLSETVKPTGETCFPLRKLRKYIEQFKIEEVDFKKHLHWYNSSSSQHDYIDTLMQKLYHPTKEDLETDDEILMYMIRVF